jgi:protein-disulfide isomerase
MSCKKNRYNENNDSLCIETRAGFCAARLNRFWQWNDAVLAHPKPEAGKARNQYETALAKKLGFPLEDFERCLAGDEASAYAQRVLQSSQRAGITATPLYRVEDRILNLRQLVAFIEERL